MAQWDDSETPTDPHAGVWSPADLDRLRPIYEAFFQQHPGLDKWGSVDDALRGYQSYREQGMDDNQAREALTNGLNSWYADNGARVNAPAPTTGPTPTPNPNPNPNPAPTTQAAPAPTYGASGPTFNAPGYTPPPAFSYSSFVAPDPSQLDKDPMYVDTLRREQDAIQRSATARGVLNTGGTIDELLRNAKDVASTGYANIFNRDLSTYQTNRTNALDQYNTNYSTQFKDPYQYKYMGAQDAYNSNQHNYDLSQQYGWYQNLFDWQKQQDLFNDKYKLLSL